MKLSKDIIIVDRIESNFAICEQEDKVIKIDMKCINGMPKDGDILIKKDSFYYIDEELTNNRKAVVDDLMKGMWE
ncbi:DUF3006 domain-containing protein [Clostridium manihotivorum]|uniref:DUF3006 domain-containing protein n=1 Tax=Clostridium manihotivorum TaxID=2320868 RepID=A0A410E0H3_9CLOT|nr:DUF3006 domain-containing protein [Clostridium manihotivorum]QAA34815.1 DUF3006 domain-containing protein [Clostridium manihotivorum]